MNIVKVNLEYQISNGQYPEIMTHPEGIKLIDLRIYQNRD